MEEILEGQAGVDIARRKARYGHKDWIVWRDKGGVSRAARASASAIKMAMLATGTQGHFLMYTASGGSMIMSWSVAALVFKNLRFLEGRIK